MIQACFNNVRILEDEIIYEEYKNRKTPCILKKIITNEYNRYAMIMPRNSIYKKAMNY